ncbi:MAG: exonuclease SbcCD subunit D [Actinobacteria bacterium]|nr:exonuclease SbcCD subunit D [Actinomycetota bacterium]
MRILHTADWHVGKKLGRVDRTEEFQAVLDEIISIARDQKLDMAIVAGDLFDRALPPLGSLGMVLDALMRLADVAGQVVVIPGNHDSPELFEILAPMLGPRGVHIVSRINKPNEGGVIKVSSRDGNSAASVACFPFLHEAQVVDFMTAPDGGYSTYADKVKAISATYCAAFEPGSVGILVGHWFIEGAEVGGGERKIHLGQQYSATSHSIPAGASYVALGHIHRPQAIEGSLVPARYAGSILQLDFSERTHNKEVVIVDADPSRPAKVTSVQLSTGRRLIRVEDTIESLEKRVDELKDAYLDVRVVTDGPVFGLAERVKALLPDAVMVQAIYDRQEQMVRLDRDQDSSLADLYAEYYASPRGHATTAPAELIEAMRQLEDEVVRASS